MTKKYAVGVDFGGTKVLSAVVNIETGEILASEKKKRKQAKEQDEVVSKICNTIDEALQEANVPISEILGIGIGAAGMTDRQNGILLAAANIGSTNVKLAEPLTQKYGVPVQLGNDVEVATLAEKSFGAGVNCDNFLCVFVGTGVGSGLVVNGSILRGHTGVAGEIGHTTLFPDGRQCGCGGHGCLEAYASRTAIAKAIVARIRRGEESVLANQIDESKGILRSKAIFQALSAGDKLAEDAVKQGAEFLGIGLTSSLTLLNPEKLILGGGLIESVPHYFETARDEIQKRILPITGSKLIIEKSVLGDYAGVVGSALLIVEQQQLNPEKFVSQEIEAVSTI